MLNRLQQAALDKALELVGLGGVLLVTGPAGTGKSYAINAIREKLSTITLAPTGLAAVNVGGQSIHSFFGIRPSACRPVYKRLLAEKQRTVLENVDAVIIDEVSMCRVDIMEAIDDIMRHSLTSTKPFGGKLMIMVGDPYQIAPVVTSYEDEYMQKFRSPYFFDSPAFLDSNPTTIELTEPMRQKDAEFLNALNSIRDGSNCNCAFDFFNSLICREPDSSSVQLVQTNKACDEINRTELDAIFSKGMTYKASWRGDFIPAEDTRTPVELTLKPSTRVMATANTDDTYNGQLGTVVECLPNGVEVRFDDEDRTTFVPSHKWTKFEYEFDEESGEHDETEVGAFFQVPLIPAYAWTWHKAQGQTINRVHVRIERPAWSPGMLYVALSRTRTPEGLTISRTIFPRDNMVSEDVRRFMDSAISPGDWEGVF